MPLFQKTIIAKFLKNQNKDKVLEQYAIYKNHFLNPNVQENIKKSKEEEYQEGFLEDLFVKILGYTKKPQPNYNLESEKKNLTDSKKADGAILINEQTVAVIELKSTHTIDLSKVEYQAFGYKNSHKNCTYVIVSNFEKLRFFIDDKTEFLEFNLFQLSEKDFELLYLCLAFENIKNNIPKQIKDASITQEKDITERLYKDYTNFKNAVFQDFLSQNTPYNALELFKKTQKLLDRFLFIFFAEDRHLLPANSIRSINQQWKSFKGWNDYRPLYKHYQTYFGFLQTGLKNEIHDIFAFNGGLFDPDEVLDNITIDDKILLEHSQRLSDYDFNSEVDVNILGHIFENSLNEIDEIKAQLENPNGENPLEKNQTKRKKDGVFYTPRYITQYIINQTVGKLCAEKKEELNIQEIEFLDIDAKTTNKKEKQLWIEKLTTYRNWLLQITILDPACGSGAFLNEALNFLIEEHEYIDTLQAKVFGDSFMLTDVETSILENNLFGVDLNEESVEIAKLSLWLRTARPNRKLTNLNNNMKCGNSLIDDPAVAGEKAFNWQVEFPHIFSSLRGTKQSGFDVVVGNPPYVQVYDVIIKSELERKYDVFKKNNDLYSAFYNFAINVIKEKGMLGFITPNSFVKGDFFTNLRELFIKYQIISIVDFNNFLVFQDANVFSAILILEKNKPYKNWILKSDLNTIKGEIEIGNSSFIQENIILNKFKNQPKFDDYFHVKDVGFNYWSVGGEKKRGNSIGDRILYKGLKQNINDISYIKGSNFSRYSDIENENFLKNNYKDFLNENDIFRFSEDLLKTNPKLIYRQTSSTLIATADFKSNFCDKTVHIIVNKENVNINYLYTLAIFNSKLLNYFYKLLTEELGRAFAQVKTINIKKLPFILSKNQTPFIEKADVMLTLHQELQDKAQKFQRNLKREFSLEDLPKKLQEWYLLPYAEFLKELEKKKIKLTLAQKSEWESYFLQESKETLSIKTKIDQTDQEIDQMVYALYGLTEEEIAVVELG